MVSTTTSLFGSRPDVAIFAKAQRRRIECDSLLLCVYMFASIYCDDDDNDDDLPPLGAQLCLVLLADIAEEERSLANVLTMMTMTPTTKSYNNHPKRRPINLQRRRRATSTTTEKMTCTNQQTACVSIGPPETCGLFDWMDAYTTRDYDDPDDYR